MTTPVKVLEGHGLYAVITFTFDTSISTLKYDFCLCALFSDPLPSVHYTPLSHFPPRHLFQQTL